MGKSWVTSSHEANAACEGETDMMSGHSETTAVIVKGAHSQPRSSLSNRQWSGIVIVAGCVKYSTEMVALRAVTQVDSP